MSDGTDPVAHLYYREGCHLCEELAAFLFRHWPEVGASMVWVDVDRNAKLAACYGLEVPVLEFEGALVCRSAPDPERLSRYFGPPRIPV